MDEKRTKHSPKRETKDRDPNENVRVGIDYRYLTKHTMKWHKTHTYSYNKSIWKTQNVRMVG